MPRRTQEHNLSSSDPRIHERLDRASEVLFGDNLPGSPNFGSLHMEPPVDVYETRTEVVASIEMAGIRDEAAEIIVEGRLLIIRGSRRALSGPAERAYHLMEIGHGPYQREIHLPADVNPEELRTVYKDGILEITLPKAPAGRGKHLRITVGQTGPG
jgi:HSP20 family protein